jgi:hypothetical protein
MPCITRQASACATCLKVTYFRELLETTGENVTVPKHGFDSRKVIYGDSGVFPSLSSIYDRFDCRGRPAPTSPAAFLPLAGSFLGATGLFSPSCSRRVETRGSAPSIQCQPEPPRRTTFKTRTISSGVKGFISDGRPAALMNASVSPPITSPVLKITRWPASGNRRTSSR